MRFWPLIPMLVGTAYIVQGRDVARLGDRAGVAAASARRSCCATSTSSTSDLADFLPLILVAVGLKVIFARRRHERPRRPGMPDPAQPRLRPACRRRSRRRATRPFAATVPVAAGPAPRAGTGAGPAPGGAPRPASAARSSASSRSSGARIGGSAARSSHVEVSAVMGGCDVDLRDAVPTTRSDRDPGVRDVGRHRHPRPARLDRRESRRGRSWAASWTIRRRRRCPTHRVILRGMAFMGGVEIKN